MKSESFSNSANPQKRLRQINAQSKKMQRVTGGVVTDPVAGWLAGQYAATAHEAIASADAPRRWEILRAMVRDWHLLRRGDQTAARLQLARESFDWRRANTQAEKEKEFRVWVKRPDIREELFPGEKGGLSPETIAKIERELNLL